MRPETCEVNFFGSYDGHVYAYDSQTGKLVWKSDYIGEQWENTYGNQAFNGASRGAGGVLYYSTSTTYSMQPRTRFQELVAINETTGKFLWTLPIGVAPTAVAYGYLLGSDGENGMQYCIGKGKTDTTVTIQSDVISKGSSVLIKGTVMDLSPGQPNTPAVSDSDMNEWMDYLHGQNATLINTPPKPEGVPVKLTAVGSDGTVVDLGTAASNSEGLFAKAWTPPTEDLYMIYASFEGSNSYWSSSAATALAVDSPTAPTASPTPPASQVSTSPDMPMAIVGVGVAMIIAVAIATVLILRKH